VKNSAFHSLPAANLLFCCTYKTKNNDKIQHKLKLNYFTQFSQQQSLKITKKVNLTTGPITTIITFQKLTINRIIAETSVLMVNCQRLLEGNLLRKPFNLHHLSDFDFLAGIERCITLIYTPNNTVPACLWSLY